MSALEPQHYWKPALLLLEARVSFDEIARCRRALRHLGREAQRFLTAGLEIVLHSDCEEFAGRAADERRAKHDGVVAAPQAAWAKLAKIVPSRARVGRTRPRR